MPEISLSDSQYDTLERVRADVEEAFVEGYGHARLSDALDYLLDTYTPPAEADSVANAAHFERLAEATFSDLQHVAAEVDDIPGSGISSAEMRGELLTELGAVELADRLAAIDDGDAATAAPDVEAEGAAEHDADEEADAESAAEEEAADDEPVDPVTAPGGALAAANQLLREHADNWRKTDGGEQPYEVDLPDGSTKGVRTKDDVRQLLFKHY